MPKNASSDSPPRVILDVLFLRLFVSLPNSLFTFINVHENAKAVYIRALPFRIMKKHGSKEWRRTHSTCVPLKAYLERKFAFPTLTMQIYSAAFNISESNSVSHIQRWEHVFNWSQYVKSVFEVMIASISSVLLGKKWIRIWISTPWTSKLSNKIMMQIWWEIYNLNFVHQKAHLIIKISQRDHISIVLLSSWAYAQRVMIVARKSCTLPFLHHSLLSRLHNIVHCVISCKISISLWSVVFVKAKKKFMKRFFMERVHESTILSI